MRRTYESNDLYTRTLSRRSSMPSSCRVWTTVTPFLPYHQDTLLISARRSETHNRFSADHGVYCSVNVFRNTFAPLFGNFLLYLKEARTNQECKHR